LRSFSRLEEDERWEKIKAGKELEDRNMPSICDGHELFDRFIAATFFNEDGGEYDFIIVGAGSAGS